MTSLASFTNAGWDIDGSAGTDTVWRIYDGLAAPVLRSFLKPLTLTVGGAKTYDGTTALTGTQLISGTSFDAGKILGIANTGSANVGSYSVSNLTVSGLYSGQTGYDLTVIGGTTAITPAALIVSANAETKVYDASSYSGGNGAVYTGFVGVDNAAGLGGNLIYSGTSQGATDAGTYTLTPGGLASSNYTITYVGSTLTITPKTVTVSAGDLTKTYDGQTYLAPITYTASGLLGSDTLTGVASFTGSGTSAVNAGIYGIAVSGLSASSNYTIAFAPSTLTINPAALTVRVKDATKAYDGLAYSGGDGVTYSGFVAGEGTSVLSGVLSYSGSSQGAVDAGTYGLSASGLSSSNYVITYVGGSLVVSPAPLTVTLANASKTYDGLAFTGGNGAAYSGFVGSDDASDLGGSLTYGGTSQGALNAGSYAITGSGLTSSNYDISYVDGALTIGRAALTAQVANASKTYDGLAYAGGNGVAFTGFVGSDDASDLGGSIAYGGTAQGALNAGSYAITGSGLTSSNYDISYVDGALTIGRAALTAQVANASKTYDGLAYAGGNGVTFTGFVGSDNASNLGGSLAYGGTAQGAVNAGTYGLAASGLSSANYDISYVAGNLTVDKAALTVLANSTVKTYDGLSFAGGAGFTFNGLAGNDTTSDLTGSLSYGGSAQGARNAGTYEISAGGLSSNNYTIAYQSGSLTIDPARLSVSANSVTIPNYASYLPLTYTVKGLVDGDSASAVLTGELITAADTRRAGTYSINQGTLAVASPNYVLAAFDAGTVIVEGRAADRTPNGGALHVANQEGTSESATGISPGMPHVKQGIAGGHLSFDGNFIP